MTQISVAELKANAGKYIMMLEDRDIFITDNGKFVARLTAEKVDKVKAAKSLFGLIHEKIDLDTQREERLG